MVPSLPFAPSFKSRYNNSLQRLFFWACTQHRHQPQTGPTPKTGASPPDGQIFRQVSEQFPSHFSSTKRANAGGNFRSYESSMPGAESTSFLTLWRPCSDCKNSRIPAALRPLTTSKTLRRAKSQKVVAKPCLRVNLCASMPRMRGACEVCPAAALVLHLLAAAALHSGYAMRCSSAIFLQETPFL